MSSNRLVALLRLSTAKNLIKQRPNSLHLKANKACVSLTINKLLVVNGHAKNPANKTKVVQVMFVANPRVRIDLEDVLVTR